MFLKHLLILIVTISLTLSARKSKHLPTYFPRCYRDSVDLADCLLKATEEVKPYLRKGVPELNMPAISPFLIPEISLEQGTNSVEYKAGFKNVVIQNLDSYKFKNFEFDIDKAKFKADVTVTDLVIDGDYIVNGKILSVPLEGKGRVQTNITSANSAVVIHGKYVIENNYTFIDVPKIDISVDIGDVSYTINGLFEDNEVLEKAVKNVVKNNLRELIEESKPVIERVLADLLDQMIANSVSNVDFNELYPVREKTKR